LVWHLFREKAIKIKTNAGNDAQADQMGGGVLGATGTATGVASTTMTDSGAAWTTNAYAGKLVTLGATYGVVLSNTGTVLTVDRWYTPGSPGGAAASTPSTGVYVILPGGAPAWYQAITANSTNPASGDTTLSGEITTSGGGLVRKLATYAHTTGAASYTLTGVFTANGSDSLPVTIAKMGTFNSIASGRMVFETLVSPTATLSASGDALTLTQTIST
jgi:hypothetical protein